MNAWMTADGRSFEAISTFFSSPSQRVKKVCKAEMEPGHP